MLWLSIGLAMRALVIQGGHPELASPDEAAPQFLQFHAGPVSCLLERLGPGLYQLIRVSEVVLAPWAIRSWVGEVTRTM